MTVPQPPNNTESIFALEQLDEDHDNTYEWNDSELTTTISTPSNVKKIQSIYANT